jgi:hypothetical protein
LIWVVFEYFFISKLYPGLQLRANIFRSSHAVAVDPETALIKP